MRLDAREPARFLCTGYDSRDLVAIFLKSYRTGRVMQRILSVARVLSPGFQTWLRTLNVGPDRWNVYVSVNAIAPRQRARTRDAIGTVRHVFLDIDAEADVVMNKITHRLDLPFPSYLVRTSPNRMHVLWRVWDVAKEEVEELQRQLARDVGADLAATPCSQTTRLPGFFNQKYASPYPVIIEYAAPNMVYSRDEFPQCEPKAPAPPVSRALPEGTNIIDRARRYVAVMEPAVAGQHGDHHTFQVACRLVRGFALSDVDALALLVEWNTRCEPPWTLEQLQAKLQHAHRYGREPIGGLLQSSDCIHPHTSGLPVSSGGSHCPPSHTGQHHTIAAPLACHTAASSTNGSEHLRQCPNVSDLADCRSSEVSEKAMPKQQQKRTPQQSQPSERVKLLPRSAVKFVESTSAGGRLAFVDVVINEDTFPLFNGLKVCSFVVLKPKEPGGPRRVYVPGHQLPSGQRFQHLQEEDGDLNDLRQAILAGYVANFASGATSKANATDENSFDEEQVAEEEITF